MRRSHQAIGAEHSSHICDAYGSRFPSLRTPTTQAGYWIREGPQTRWLLCGPGVVSHSRRRERGFSVPTPHTPVPAPVSVWYTPNTVTSVANAPPSLSSWPGRQNSQRTPSTDTPPTYQRPPFPTSSNFKDIHCLSAIATRCIRKPAPLWQSQWRSGKRSSLSAKKIISTIILPTDRDRLEEGFSPDSKSHKVYNRTLAIECKVSRVFCDFVLWK